MNEIIKYNEDNIISKIQTKDKLKININNQKDSNIIESLKNFMNELSDDGKVFKYNILNHIQDIDKIEISIECLFDTNYFYMICNSLEHEINYNSIMIEHLKQQEFLSSAVNTLFDKRIDDLTLRNDELIKQQKIVKMQLLNAIDKRDSLISKITDYINNSISNSVITHISATSEIEKAFMDVNSLLN